MLIKLPVLNNNKKINVIFKVDVLNDKIIINPYSCKNKLYEVICFNNRGINTQMIYFPLIFFYEKNMLYNEFFYYLKTIKSENNDFFNILINSINEKLNKNFKFIKNVSLDIIQNMQKKYENPINNFDNIESFLNYTFYRNIYFINLVFFINSKTSDKFKIFINKKFKLIQNTLNNMNFFINGNNIKFANINSNNRIYIYIDYFKEILLIIVQKIYKNKLYEKLFLLFF